MNQELVKLFTVSALAAALAACGGSDNDNNDNGSRTNLTYFNNEAEYHGKGADE